MNHPALTIHERKDLRRIDPFFGFGVYCHRLLDDLEAAEAKLAALRVNPDVLDLIRQSLVLQESETVGGDWRYAYAIEFVDSLRPHSADPSSEPPPVRNPATPPSGR